MQKSKTVVRPKPYVFNMCECPRCGSSHVAKGNKSAKELTVTGT